MKNHNFLKNNHSVVNSFKSNVDILFIGGKYEII